MKKVCGICPSHGHTDIGFDEKHLWSRKRRPIPDNFTTDKIDLVFPVGQFQGEKSFEGYKYIPIVEVPGFVLIKTTNSKPIYVRAVMSSLLDCWPYFALNISTMVLAGIVIWVLVGYHVFALTFQQSYLPEYSVIDIRNFFLSFTF